ncbi:MAG TPA: hypothetical protein VG871_10190 [Vicinamibacterales bacterium]|nr:hypothetical protein [Vicinamibacterales bacterium]
MNKPDIARYTMLRNVRDFGAAHPELFPKDSLGAKQFAALTAAVGELEGYVTSQRQGRSAARDTTMTKDAAREAIHGALDAVARTARAMAADTPGLAGRFHLVAIRSDHELVTTARAFAGDAAPLAGQFVAHGLPAGFLDDLSSAVEAFEQATRGRVAAREARVAARAGIAVAMNAAFGALSRLDAMVVNALGEQPTLLAEWLNARHVERVSRKHAPGKAAGEAPASAPAASGTVKAAA